METIGNDLKEVKPVVFTTVPRLLEKVYEKIDAKGSQLEGFKRKIFDWAVNLALQYDINKPKSFFYSIQLSIADRLVYSKWREAVGGKIKAIVTGSAACQVKLLRLFTAAKIIVMEGYGLTETTAGATLNLYGAQRVGSVGKPIPGTSIKIAEDGEVLIRGPIVMQGYWQNNAANDEVFDGERWFKSGDLGKLDDEGFLYIVGRKKEIIVTAGGKNVAPAVLEDRLRSHPLVSQCMVVGDNQPFIAALVTIDPDALKAWVVNHKKDGASINDLINDPDLIAVVQTAVDEANKAVSKAESIRKFTILPVDFTIAGGHLTAKLSVKRHVVAKEFAHEIDALFSK
jgi:long-chain acyl-CoA synthetase